MSETVVQRSYPLPGLNFRDFWDICLNFQRTNPQYRTIAYTVDGQRSYVVLEETNVAVVLRKLTESRDKVRKYLARFTAEGEEGASLPAAELVYRPEAYDDHEAGLSLHCEAITKYRLFAFEDQLFAMHDLEERLEPRIEFGKPCEILAGIFDMRGFSTFCEQPNIESPYTCGVMTAFYHLVQQTFVRYPPDLIKFAGDGVTAIWQTTVEDRKVAIDVLVRGAISIHGRWQFIRHNPHFSHGAPEEIGCGISFGLASRLSVDHDYIGRPINLASRLCGVCGGGKVLVDKTVPSLPENLEKRETRVRIKSFGEYNAWQFSGE